MSRCTVCGSTPAAKGTVWLVTGLILWLKWEQDAGPFCRTCGTAVARHYTNRTMLTGWWGLFAFFANLWAIGANLVAARRFASLPQPLPQSGVAGDANAPLKPGKPLPLRPGPYVSLLAVGALVVWVGADLAGQADRDDRGAIVRAGDVEATRLKVGDCFDIPASDFAEVQARPCSQPHDAELVGRVRYPGPDRQPFPSDRKFFAAARSRCMKDFANHVGVPLRRSKLEMGIITPTKLGWGGGDRQIQCVATRRSGKLDSSVRDSKR